MPNTTIKVILFDADGVLQSRTTNIKTEFAALIDSGADVDSFVSDIFSAEVPCLSGLAGLEQCFAPVLLKWNSNCSVDDILNIFTMVRSNPDVVAMIKAIRRSGIQCYLASNQQMHRALYMSEELGYAQLFDAEFYSCHVGAAKPDATFFQAILTEVGHKPNEILFIDDLAENVRAAQLCGIQAIQFHISSGVRFLQRTLSASGINIKPI